MSISRPDQFQSGSHIANSCFDHDSFLATTDDMWGPESSSLVVLFFLSLLISSGDCFPRGGRGGGGRGGGRSGGRGRGWFSSIFSSSPRRSSYGGYSSRSYSSSEGISRTTTPPPDTILSPTGHNRSILTKHPKMRKFPKSWVTDICRA